MKFEINEIDGIIFIPAFIIGYYAFDNKVHIGMVFLKWAFDINF